MLCERLLDGSGPTVFALLDKGLAQGHDDLGDALGVLVGVVLGRLLRAALQEGSVAR